MSTQETALVQMEQAFVSLALNREPKEVLAEAAKAANAVKEVIDKKPKKVIFNGEVYLENEDWLTIARFYGVTVKTKSTVYVEFGPVHGWEATSEAYLVSTGQVIGSADAMCLNDEENWGMRPKYEWQNGKRVMVGQVAVPLFQLRSMAQTRASSKVCSSLFKWVVVLAGFRPTPAEEVDQNTIDATDQQQSANNQGVRKPERKAKPEGKPEAPKEPEKPRDPDCITEPQGKRLYAIARSVKLTDEELRSQVKLICGVEHSKEIKKSLYEKLIDSIDPDFKFHEKPGTKGENF